MIGPTDYETSKKSIYPSHDQGLRYHHRHVALHHSHHAFHSRWIRHWVRSGFASCVGILEESPIFVCRDKVILARGKGG